jgi:sodium transport system ATP-binding protein
MTAWEMVEHFGRLYGYTREELRPRIEDLFHRLRMSEIRDCLGGKMSTGMKQKVLIARALVHDPPVLIFDEATTGLDVLAARAVLETVQELRDLGKCVVFSTHIMREVEKVCDRVAILYRGSILAEGTVDELRDHHAQRDFEELFFQLLRQYDESQPQVAGVNI